MANTFLVDDRIIHQVLENGLGMLYQKCNLIKTLHMGFKGEFARRNRPVGKKVKVERPMSWDVKSGATLQLQDITDSYDEVTVNNHSQVSFPITIDELTFNVTEFTEKYIGTAMRDIASHIENAAIDKLYKSVNQQIGGFASTDTFDNDMIVDAETRLAEGLSPEENKYCIVDPVGFGSFKKGIRSTYNPQDQISKYFKGGAVTDGVAGFRALFRNTFMPYHTSGTYVWDSTNPIKINGANQTGTTLTVDGGTTGDNLKAGDIVQISGVSEVHPQTKESISGRTKQVCVAEDWSLGDTSLKIAAPGLITSGPHKNCSGSPADNADLGNNPTGGGNGGASQKYKVALAYHKDFATFVSIPFAEPPKSERYGSAVYWQQKEMDGINMALCIDWDNQNYRTVMRIDVAWDVSLLRQQLVTRVAHY